MILLKTLTIFVALLSCQEQVASKNTHKKPKISKATTTKKVTSNFVGNFSGTRNQKEIFVTLTIVPRTNKIKGVLTMDGRTAQITATEINGVCTGKIIEDDTQKKYNITAEIVNRKLHFNITFPKFGCCILET